MKVSKNLVLICLMDFLAGFLFFLPVLALYLQKSLFSVQNAAIIFSIQAISSAVLNIPTGVLADKIGRKKVLITTYLSLLISVILLLFAGNSMTFFMMYAFFSGGSMALGSGCIQSFIYDSLKENGEEGDYKKVIGFFYAIWPLGASLSAIIGGYIASFSIKASIYYSLIPVLIAVIMSFFLREPSFHKSESNPFSHAKESFLEILNNNEVLILFIGSLLLMSIGESIHNFNPVFLQAKNLPIIYFGYYGALSFGLSSLGHYMAHGISEKLGNKKTLVMAVFLSPIIGLASTFCFKFEAAVLLAIPSIFFGIKNVVTDYLFNKNLTSSHRATINSIAGFANMAGIAVVIPFFGRIADLYSIVSACRIGLVVLLIVPILYLFIKEDSKIKWKI